MVYPISMGKVSPKTIFYAAFCAWGVVYLGGCVEPIDLNRFVNDPEVGKIIEQGSGTVNLWPNSPPNLKRGNQEIAGLERGYYLVEEWNNAWEPLSLQFVSASGKRSEALTDIGMIDDSGKITGLTNDNYYRLTPAQPYPNDVYYTLLTSAVPELVRNTRGTIALPAPNDGTSAVYSIIPPSTDVAPNIVEISTPSGPALAPRRSQNRGIITLVDMETITDYIFFWNTEDGIGFYVLEVVADLTPPLEPEDLIVTINLAPYPGNIPPNIITPSPSVTYQQNENTVIVLLISNSVQYETFAWYIDGEKLEGETGLFFRLNTSLPEYKIIGVYTITAEATTKDGKPYSATVGVEVIP